MPRQYQCFDIVEIPASITKIGKATHAHPFVIYEITVEYMYAMCISTQINTYYTDGVDFMIYTDEDGFDATGLSAESFVKNLDYRISKTVELRVLGKLDGELLARFQEFLRRNSLI